jgi:DNA-binding LacI/PurR family transcriptional regulator
VDQNSRMIAKTAATLALKLAQTKDRGLLKSTLLAPQLVVRASSLRARNVRKPA